jgi:hypothetical protein
MNQKAFAIFVGAIMVLSVFAGFVMLGGSPNSSVESPTAIETASLDEFGMSGRLVDWSFSSLEEMLEMCPENTVFAYWIDLKRSDNLTAIARDVLPPSYGLNYGDTLYPTKIAKLGAAQFNDTLVEFHWIPPFRVGYENLMIPYEGYLIIPGGLSGLHQYGTVIGRPTLFGPQESLKRILDVISGGLATDKLTLPFEEYADLQVAGLGSKASGSSLKLPLGGGYEEFYIGVNAAPEGYVLAAKYLLADSVVEKRLQDISEEHGLKVSKEPDLLVVSGTLGEKELKEVLGVLLAP